MLTELEPARGLAGLLIPGRARQDPVTTELAGHGVLVDLVLPAQDQVAGVACATGAASETTIWLGPPAVTMAWPPPVRVPSVTE